MSSAVQIAQSVRSAERSAREVLDEYLAVIAERESEVHAFNLVTTEQAIAAATAVDEQVAQGINPGLLAGVPVAIKDNLCTRGVATTCSSKILQGLD
ncbi:MAG: amidase family protein, partial [Microthrixaceae bacterium]